MSADYEIKVWMCPECGYWRQDKSTGVHATPNPDDPNGPLATHELRLMTFVREDIVEERIGAAIVIERDYIEDRT